MLTITIGEDEFYDEEAEEFKTSGGFTVDFEHSLVSLSKWESKYQKPFLVADDKTAEETYGYIEAMVISNNFSSDMFELFQPHHFAAINRYIESPQSATTIYHAPGAPSRGRPEVITGELIYYWMVAFTIPLECENWHLNRLFSLIQICSIKNANENNSGNTGVLNPDAAAQQRELNEQRKREWGTTG